MYGEREEKESWAEGTFSPHYAAFTGWQEKSTCTMFSICYPYPWR